MHSIADSISAQSLFSFGTIKVYHIKGNLSIGWFRRNTSKSDFRKKVTEWLHSVTICLLFERSLPHFLVLFHTPHENFFFDKYIFEARVVFDKVHVLGDVSVEDFGGCARRSVLFGVSVTLTEADVGWLFADGVLCHLQGVPHWDAVGKEVPRF